MIDDEQCAGIDFAMDEAGNVAEHLFLLKHSGGTPLTLLHVAASASRDAGPHAIKGFYGFLIGARLVKFAIAGRRSGSLSVDGALFGGLSGPAGCSECTGGSGWLGGSSAGLSIGTGICFCVDMAAGRFRFLPVSTSPIRIDASASLTFARVILSSTT